MKPPRRLAQAASYRLRGVTVTGLVGKGGTGKSFRARLLAEKNGIDLIVDDGILVYANAILAGHWAKKEDTLVAATRRALFDAMGQAEEAREALRAVRFRSVLVVGTSGRMVRRIASALDLPRPSRLLTIDEVAHAEEIRAAGRPAVVTAEKPAKGGVAISEGAVVQMVRHCVDEHDPLLSVGKVRIRGASGMYDIRVDIRVPFGHGTAGDLHRLRDSIMHSQERHAGIVVREVRLVIESVQDLAPGAPSSGMPSTSPRRSPRRGRTRPPRSPSRTRPSAAPPQPWTSPSCAALPSRTDR